MNPARHMSERLRPAEPADSDELFRMARLLATSEVPRREPFERALAAILGDPSQQIIVVPTTSGLAGYLYGLVHPAFHANGYIGWVEELFVDETQRDCGLGRALMDRFERWARDLVEIGYIAVASRRAGDFYRAIGYRPSATYYKKSFSRDGPDEPREQFTSRLNAVSARPIRDRGSRP